MVDWTNTCITALAQEAQYGLPQTHDAEWMVSIACPSPLPAIRMQLVGGW